MVIKHANSMWIQNKEVDSWCWHYVDNTYNLTSHSPSNISFQFSSVNAIRDCFCFAAHKAKQNKIAQDRHILLVSIFDRAISPNRSLGKGFAGFRYFIGQYLQGLQYWPQCFIRLKHHPRYITLRKQQLKTLKKKKKNPHFFSISTCQITWMMDPAF